MKRSVLISLLVVSPMLFLSCQKSKDSSSSSAIQPNPEPVNVSTISKGSESNVSIPEEMVIRDEKSLNEFWEKIPPTYLPATYPYHVDFSKESILAVFLGNQDSSGASVLIEGVIDENPFIVNVSKISPNDACINLPVVTTPYHAIKVNRALNPTEVVFNTKEKISPCPNDPPVVD